MFIWSNWMKRKINFFSTNCFAFVLGSVQRWESRDIQDKYKPYPNVFDWKGGKKTLLWQHKTTCQFSCTKKLQCVSKNLMTHSLLRNWFARAQCEAEITRFPNMYDKGGLFSQILSRITFLSKKKKTLEKVFFWWPPIWGNITLGVLVAKPVTSGQLLGYPKSWGHNASF